MSSGPPTRTLADRDPRFVLVPRFRLSVARGPDRGQVFESAASKTVIGTHRSAELVLQDDTLSRFHCEIEVQDGTATITDLESRNGTFVEGVQIFRARLHDKARIQIGRSELRFEVAKDSVKMPLAERVQLGELVGRSSQMRRVFELLERAAHSDVAVLIEGETGTGKELAAEAIHTEGSRRNGPFVVVDCGAINSRLLESELFGHVRGAFTGAIDHREGAFESASGGTVFLDEIGELDGDVQKNFLRVVERQQVKRIGSDRYVSVNVRIVSATNRNLQAEVNARRFREDLYYRLVGMRVRLPPLRERTEDLPLLIDKMLEDLGAADHALAFDLRTPDRLAELARYHWPGNIRELRGHLERSLVLNMIAPFDADSTDPADRHLDEPLRTARARAVLAFERAYLTHLLAKHENNVTAAARAAGINRIHLHRLLARCGLR